MAIIFVIEFAPRAENWILGLLVGQLIFAVVGWKIFFSKLNVCDTFYKPSNQHISALIGFAWPIAIAVGLGWIQTQGYRFVMESNLGLLELGLFVSGYGISAGIISAFESVFTTYFQPMFYKNVSNNNVSEQSKAWCEYAGAIFPSLMLVGIVVFATAPELTRVMLGSEYWSSSQYIVWGVIAELARVASGVYGMVAHARMKTRLLLVPSLVGATLSIALIYWLMPKYGSNGVGAALMLSSMAAFIVTYGFTRNEFVANLPRRMLILSIFMGVMLILLARILRWFVGESGSFVAASAQLSLVGAIFLLFQYVLMRPILHGKQKHE
jgi:O-antigen/teichoic acid export membrane protein